MYFKDWSLGVKSRTGVMEWILEVEHWREILEWSSKDRDSVPEGGGGCKIQVNHCCCFFLGDWTGPIKVPYFSTIG